MKTLKDIEFTEFNEYGLPPNTIAYSKTLRDATKEHIKELKIEMQKMPNLEIIGGGYIPSIFNRERTNVFIFNKEKIELKDNEIDKCREFLICRIKAFFNLESEEDEEERKKNGSETRTVKEVAFWDIPCPYCKKLLQMKIISPEDVEKDEGFIEMKIKKIEIKQIKEAGQRVKRNWGHCDG